jgi:hypothetical protein
LGDGAGGGGGTATLVGEVLGTGGGGGGGGGAATGVVVAAGMLPAATTVGVAVAVGALHAVEPHAELRTSSGFLLVVFTTVPQGSVPIMVDPQPHLALQRATQSAEPRCLLAQAGPASPLGRAENARARVIITA